MSSDEHPDVVDLVVAKTPMEAQVIAGVLRDAQIPTYVSGGQLTDEFAMSQQVLGLQNVTVRVRSTDVESAKRALAEAREAGKQLDDADPED